MSDFTPTAEQQAILDAFSSQRDSIMVQADAGCAKTSTLRMLALQSARRPLPSLAIAFNKKTAVELQAKFPPHFKVMTMNGLGYGAWAKKIGGKLRVNEYKISDLIKEVASDRCVSLEEDDKFQTVRAFVNDARNVGIIPKALASQFQGLAPDEIGVWAALSDEVSPDEELIGLAREVLERSCSAALDGIVDFDDMVYCSVLMGGHYAPYPLVMVDEVQDLNMLNQRQVALVARERIIAVGDQKQAIYAFRGASANGMEDFKALRPRWIELPLHVTFRCPRAIVARQQFHAPGFRAAEANPEGSVIRWVKGDEFEGVIMYEGLRSSGWNWKWLKALCEPGEKPFVISRNNAPLMRMAFKLLRQGVIPVMLGRDIGKGLVSLSKKIAPRDSTPLSDFEELVRKWMDSECTKALKAKRQWLIAAITDRGESLLAVAETISGATVKDLRSGIAALFKRSEGDLQLSTGHRAKGLEESVVMHLDPWRLPSRFAIEAEARGEPEQMEQEMNLKYVIETRTRRVFVEANVDDLVVE